MQEYVQKSIRTTRPRSCASVSGFELSQPARPVNSGAGPKSSSSASAVSPLGRLRRLRPRQLPQLALRPVGALEPVLDRLGVAGDLRLQLLVERRRRSRSRPPRRATPAARRTVSAFMRSDLRDALARERDREHRHRGAERVGERQHDAVEADVPLRGDHRHGRRAPGRRRGRRRARGWRRAGSRPPRSPERRRVSALQRPGERARRTTATAASARRRRAARSRGCAADPPAARRGRAARRRRA